jgi:2-keto-4-pentenoate hydratase/2-oxohepta-3-ene-1,7-dioic acid hydratase in catechol pathway
MRIARVSVPGVEFPVYGVITGDKIELITGLPWPDISDPVAALNLADVKILAPVIPSKVVCVGKNYADHAKEMGGDVPTEPVIFLKPNTTVIGDGDFIVLPPQSTNVHHEAELAIVIGALAKNVEIDRADEVIFGYTCANDVTARDLQNSDQQWTRSKSFDTFCPLGPWIETEFVPDDQVLESRVDGEVKQHASITKMLHNIPEIISYVSANMTLLPGDVILTGTPSGIFPIRAGEIVECEIEGIGTLINPVV